LGDVAAPNVASPGWMSARHRTIPCSPVRMASCEHRCPPVSTSNCHSAWKDVTVSKNDDRWATCFMRTRSEGAVPGKLPCPLSPARRSQGVHGEQRDALTTHRASANACTQGSEFPCNQQTLFSWNGTHHSWQGVQMDANDSIWLHTLG